MIIAGGCFIAVIVMIVIANGYNTENIKIGFERDSLNEKLTNIYKAMKVEDQSDAITALSKEDAFDGEDLGQLLPLIVAKYGVNPEFDYTDNSKLFLRKNGVYKVISLVVKTAGGSERVFAYSKVAKTSWKLAAYNPADENNPCAKSSADEKAALKNIVTCPEED